MRIVPGEAIAKGRCICRSDDLMLIYEIGTLSAKNPEVTILADAIDHEFGLDRSPDFLLIADTLTMTFSGPEHCLTGIDAYTNRQLWQSSSFHKVPQPSGKGILVAEPSSFDGDRCSLSVVPTYETATPGGDWVRIILGSDTDSYYEVGSDLLVV